MPDIRYVVLRPATCLFIKRIHADVDFVAMCVLMPEPCLEVLLRDLRATQKIIESFERNQLQDRSEMRQLQKRIEELVAELTTLRANSLKTDNSHKTAERKKVS